MANEGALDTQTAGFSGGVSVIVPAYNSARTVRDAVRTALAERQVAEVIVVDDASSDGTADVAVAAACGSERLTVIRQSRNSGPAAARNAGFEAARSPWLALVDADDFFLPGRFDRLAAMHGCDLVADNILFVSEDTEPDQVGPVPPPNKAATIDIHLAAFVRANLPGRSGERGEWGFLKPVMRRDFLHRHRLRYDPSMRLGEDYDLYVRMLQLGARFCVTPVVGYAARWRNDSLSSRHQTTDLKALAEAARRHLEFPGMSAHERSALAAQYREARKRFLLRRFLDDRARRGRLGSVLSALSEPGSLAPIARGVLSDKLAARRPAASKSRVGQTLIDVKEWPV